MPQNRLGTTLDQTRQAGALSPNASNDVSTLSIVAPACAKANIRVSLEIEDPVTLGSHSCNMQRHSRATKKQSGGVLSSIDHLLQRFFGRGGSIRRSAVISCHDAWTAWKRCLFQCLDNTCRGES